MRLTRYLAVARKIRRRQKLQPIAAYLSLYERYIGSATETADAIKKRNVRKVMMTRKMKEQRKGNRIIILTKSWIKM